MIKKLIFTVFFLVGCLSVELPSHAQNNNGVYQRIVNYLSDGISITHRNITVGDSTNTPLCDLIAIPPGNKANIILDNSIDTLTTISVYGIKFLPVKITPVNFDSITYQIKFTSYGETSVPDMMLSDYEIDIIKRISVNPNSIFAKNKKITSETNTAQGYLIVTHSDFGNAASILAHNKRLLGFNVRVCSGEDWTPNKIRQCVKRMYKEIPNLKYLCLLGDYNHLPSFEGTTGCTDEAGFYPTDQFFGCIKDSLSILPELSIGRITATDLYSANAIIKKLAEYDFSPDFPNEFYSTVTYAAPFNGIQPEYEKDSYEFCKYIEKNAYHVETKHGLNVNRVYYTQPFSNPKYWNKGENVPDFLQRPTFNWLSSTEDFVTAMNTSGKYLMCYAHGSYGKWEMIPIEIRSSLIKTLSNSQRPLIISISCSTGRFSPDAIGGCLAQNFLNNPNGGAIGVIAATDAIPLATCPALTHAFTNGILGSPTLNDGDFSCFTVQTNILGELINNSIVDILPSIVGVADPTPIRRKLMLFGDPAMKLRNQKPQKIECLVRKDSSYPHKYHCSIVSEVAPTQITIVDRYKGEQISLPIGIKEFQYDTEYPEFVTVCAYSSESIPGVCNLADNTNSIIFDGMLDVEINRIYKTVIIGDSFKSSNDDSLFLPSNTSFNANQFIFLPGTEIPADANVEFIIN